MFSIKRSVTKTRIAGVGMRTLLRNIACGMVLLCIAHLELRAQGAATFHVFPQVADGIVGLSGYISALSVINVSNQPSSCTFRLYGPVSDRLSGPPTFTLATGSFIVGTTRSAEGRGLPLETGYGTLTCTQPVAATLFYVNLAVPSGTVAAGATVFSSPPTTRAELIEFLTAGYRTAIAIANDTDTPAQYQVTVVNDLGQQMGKASIPVPARSNTARFVDELISLPNDTLASVVITGSTPFSVVGLVFNGPVFLSEPAALLGP